ncbi:efflux RND transporter periplasmic adaptor subunit [Ruminiclostridium herbifermentans]|uniref:Efflux RND transporter periplasmic adaptor subunit n=1 Tax=Ruminiclostridium herbifermentans TaxID=2488810 RepID=A0A4U7JJF5_9FIRM|nr:HlyD family efflux transporter periplasmic adaptor subunit [Ruminiclostridium herbifermentans]QNU66197.1 efflux RND transporter periplasmic adaptor subunit [Ruminiclostridium herbifermentans]
MKKKLLTLILILIFATISTVLYITYKSRQNEVNVKVFNVKKSNITSTISAKGTVKEESGINISFKSSLKVLKVNVSEGDNVKKGDIIAILDTKPIKLQLEQLRLNYDIEKKNLELTNNQFKKNTLLLDTQIIDAKNNFEQKSLSFESLEKDLYKSKDLYSIGAISENELNDIQKSYDMAKIEMENSKKKYDSIILENKENEKNNQSQIDIQFQKVTLAKLKIDELLESVNGIDIDSGKVISPIDGCVASIGIKEGEYTNVEDSAFNIISLNNLIVLAKISEIDANSVKEGNKVIISGDSAAGNEYEGIVQSIAPCAIKETIDNTERTVINAQILITSKNTVLKPGYNVDLQITTKTINNVLSIITNAVREDENGNKYVYLVDNGKIRKIFIQIEAESGMYYGIKEVEDSLRENSKIIYYSSDDLREGLSANVIEEK